MKKNTTHLMMTSMTALMIIGYLATGCSPSKGIKTKPLGAIQSKAINSNGFQANFFARENTQNQAAVILIGGGQWGNYWAQKFADKGFVGLSLPYVGQQNLPKLPEEIELEYFEKVIKWLGKQKEVDPAKIVVMGASRNAELALVIASTLRHMVGGVIAYAPSAVAWSNTVLPYNSDEIKASWKYKGVDIPYVPMDKISGNGSDKISLLTYWDAGLSKADFVKKASIKVELIRGPILLLSGNDDKVWPSVKMADMIAKRLKNNRFKYRFRSIKYKNAGHLISGNPAQFSKVRTGRLYIDGKYYQYQLGGTNEGDFKAKKDAYIQVFKFLAELKND